MSGLPGNPVFDDVRSIGVLTASGIGDFLMTVPALRALRAAYPQARISVLGDSWHPAFLHARPGPWDEGVAVPREDGVCRLVDDPDADISRFVADHRGRYDLVVQLHGGGRDSNPLVRALGPRFSVGPRAPGAEPLDRCTPYVEGRPEVLRWLEVAELAGAEAPVGTPSLVPALTVTEGDVAAGRAVWDGPGPAVMFHVGARDGRRCWPPAKFAEVARHLRDTRGATVLLVGSEHDAEASVDVAARAGAGVVDLTGRMALGDTLGLASRCRLFVGNDSGPRHLAIAAGTPSVGIFWVGNVLTFGPLAGAAHRAVVSFTVTCPVCGVEQVEHRCAHDVSFVDSVTTDDVVEQCEQVLACPGNSLRSPRLDDPDPAAAERHDETNLASIDP